MSNLSVGLGLSYSTCVRTDRDICPMDRRVDTSGRCRRAGAGRSETRHRGRIPQPHDPRRIRRRAQATYGWTLALSGDMRAAAAQLAKAIQADPNDTRALEYQRRISQ